MITRVDIPVLVTEMSDIAGVVARGAAVVAGGATAAAEPAPAGVDEASSLAVVNTSAHTAQFLAVAAQVAAEQTRYANALGSAGFSYGVEDVANGSMFR